MPPRKMRDADILLALKETPLSWTQLLGKTNIPSSALQRRLKKLIADGSVLRTFKDNRSAYISAEKLKPYQKISISELKEAHEDNLKLLETLKLFGLFEKGINEKGILRFINSRKKHLFPSEKMAAGKPQLTYSGLMVFQHQLPFLLAQYFGDAKTKVLLKIQADPDVVKKILRGKIDEAKKKLAQ